MLRTNNEEIDFDEFWQNIDRQRELLNSDRLTLNYNSKEGLVPQEVKTQASLATNYGNSQVKLDGTDQYGDTLNGNEEDFSLSTEVPENQISRDLDTASTQLSDRFRRLLSDNIIRLPAIGTVLNDTIARIRDTFTS